jgi:hypothetical protein
MQRVEKSLLEHSRIKIGGGVVSSLEEFQVPNYDWKN